MRLLLVEDEKNMAQAIRELLRLEKYEVEWFADGEEGADQLCTGLFDIAVLDVMLPNKNGFEIARQARSCGIRTPILMLTARSEVEDRVSGLDCGADDYLTKPFAAQELLARLRALTRRSYDMDDGVLSFGDIRLDTKRMMLCCTKNGNEVRLSEKEYSALEYFMSNKDRVLTREQLFLKIWGYDSEVEDTNLEVYMSFVRKKLSFIGAKTTIKSVRGVGYELRFTE